GAGTIFARGFPPGTVRWCLRVAARSTPRDHWPAGGQGRSLRDGVRESVVANLPALPSFPIPTNRFSQYPYPHNLLCPIAPQRAPASWLALAAQWNRVVPGKLPFLRNAAPNVAADPELSDTVQRIFGYDAAPDRDPRPETVASTCLLNRFTPTPP